MVVRSQSGGTYKTGPFLMKEDSMVASLFRDCLRSLKLSCINMEKVGKSLTPIIVYSVLLSSGIFVGLVLGFLIDGSEIEVRISLGFSVGALCVMNLFFFIAGYIYRITLNKASDTSYISYVYVVAFSMTYYPLFMFVWMRISDPNLNSLVKLVLAIMSRFFIDSSMLKGHTFGSRRKSFIFQVVTLVLQLGFVIVSHQVFYLFSPIK